jgi:hypothetical protein
MASSIEKNFCVIECAKTDPCPSVQRAFRKRFLKDPPPLASMQKWLHNSENQECIARRKAVAVLVWVKRLYGRWRPLFIEVQGNLCGRKAVSWRRRLL